MLPVLMVVAFMVRPTPPRVAAAAQRTPAVQSGRAVAVSLHSILGNLVVADTGDVRGQPLSPVLRSVANLQTDLVDARIANASVTAPNPESVRSEASVSGLEVDLLGEALGNLFGTAPLLSIRIGAVQALSESSCTASPTGEVEIDFISINGNRVAIGSRPGLNARVTVEELPLVSVVLNEQISVPGGNGLTVNALHVSVENVVDLVVASARSEVADCRVETLEPPEFEIGPGIGSGMGAGAGAGLGVVRQGRVAVARGRGFLASATVRITFDRSDLQPIEATAGADGTVEVAVVVARHARLGVRTLTATSGDRSATATFLIVRPPVQPPTPPFEARSA